MLHIDNLFLFVIAALAIMALVAFVVYKAISGSHAATVALTAIVSFGLLVGAAAVGTAEAQPTYWLRHVNVEVTHDEIIFTRLSDGNMFAIDFEPGWIEGENVVIIHDNGTPEDPLDDVIVTWLEWAAMGCDAQLVFE